MDKKIYRFVLQMVAVMLGLLLLLVSSGWSTDGKGYQNISQVQFAKMMAHKDFTLINVHIPYAGEIPDTDLLIPFNAVDQYENQLPSDKDARIVVYCLTGPMGYIAAEKLVRMGYTRVAHFQGGMKVWTETGKKLLFRSH